ncbi:hypothetical protein B0H19DRAFT_1167975 [Mycena capillaripes]|nr:hypothetical protein B0H19DRAFT_1167975 [Mycena capillaripes]
MCGPISWSDNEPEEENSATEVDDECEEEPKRVASGKKSKIVETADAKKQKTTAKEVDGSKQGKKKKDDAAEPQKNKRALLAEGEPEKKTVAGTKRKTAPDQEIEPGGSKKKVACSASSLKQNLDIPTTCPICPDSLPEVNLSILLTPGHQARQLEQIDGDICGQITWEQKQDHLRRIGRKNGWPFSLDFNSIITQILVTRYVATIQVGTVLQHGSEILDLVSDEYELSKNGMGRFGGEEDPENYEYAKLRARCGYLGPQGAHLILSTICRIFAHSFADLRTKLSITVDRLIARQPKDFDHPRSGLRPALVLPIEHFIEFVLIPHVAVCLIAEDMEVSYENALDIKDASADFGDMFHWDINTAQVQDLDQANIDAVGDRSLPTTPERASPRIKKTSTNPKDSPTLFSPTSPLKRADFDSPAEGSRKYKKLRFEDPPSIAKIAPTVELTLEDFPRKSKTKAKKTHDKKSVGKDQVQSDEAETSGR